MNLIINVTSDSICALFTVIILIYLRLSADSKDKLNQILAWICVFNLGMLLGDIPNWLCEGFAKPWYPAAMELGMFVQFWSGCFLPWVYSLYMCTYLSRKAQMKNWILPTVHIMFIADAALLMLQYCNGMYYKIDINNSYQRGGWHWLSQVIPVVIVLFNAGVVLYYRRALRLKDLTAFLSYMMLPVIGIVLQTMFYGTSTTYLTCTISIFIIFLCIQSEQQLISEQQKRDLDKAHLLVMLSQIQPHFLYNSLQGIKMLCDTDPPRASEALEHFSFYLRGNLDSLVDVQLVPFERELVHIQDYLFLEKMRFSEQLNIQWQLEYKDFIIPPLTVQPLIENAIRHGINKKTGGGTLTIKTQQVKDEVIITIHDDGAGFDPAEPKTDGRSHIGIENTRNRISTLCGGTLLIESEKGVGTTATIILPQNKAE